MTMTLRPLLGRLGLWVAVAAAGVAVADDVDFNRDVRPILSNACYRCHGPDDAERKAGLRLDVRDGVTLARGRRGPVVVAGRPDSSQLIERVTTADDDDRMPPAGAGKRLSAAEVDVLRRWIEGGAEYARHWSYVTPRRPSVPAVENEAWPVNAIDRFLLAELEARGLGPAAPADRHAMARRVSLALVGLPPTPAEVRRFVADRDDGAYERYVDRLLARSAFGEHWARMWLDLARYADSAGYADDPPRTIWAFRDYVIRSFNDNKPFDVFTIEQIAGDLLPDPTDEQLVATAFHRNTLTNNEGGTNDEEYRNVAIVDRVNTTLAVWMGTTMACAQCHTHKYDPITQEEYFRFFDIFNQTEDADRRDESPTLRLFTREQRMRQAALREEVASLESVLSTPTDALRAEAMDWVEALERPSEWRHVEPGPVRSEAGAEARRLEDGSVLVSRGGKTDTYTVDVKLDSATRLAALRLETLPHESLPEGGSGHGGGNFVVTRVGLSVTPPGDSRLRGRFVRVSLPGKRKFLSLAEVEVYAESTNLALSGTARQSSTAFNGPAKLAIDGNTDGRYEAARSTTHTEQSDDPWWEVDLGASRSLDRIVVWNRTDNDLQSRLSGFRVEVLDANRTVVWERQPDEVPDPSSALALSGTRLVPIISAFADHEQPGFVAASLVTDRKTKSEGWAVGGRTNAAHELTLVPGAPVDLAAGTLLRIRIEQRSKHEFHTVGRFRLSLTDDPGLVTLGRMPAEVAAIVRTPVKSPAQREELVGFYVAEVSPTLASERRRLANARSDLAGMKPGTTVPIQRERRPDRRRQTFIQLRGNYLQRDRQVTAGIPAALRGGSETGPIDRLGVARWLVAADNPLTARVLANRFWEQIFGVGIVRTSEEFGSQGELPSHPELLDWLAVEFVESGWNVKRFLKLLVMSAAYRQSTRVTPDLAAMDPRNRLLARGPRFRMSAEMIRDQALAASGLLSPKMFGPPVRPPQPTLGLNAAFGGGVDWTTSAGQDRYRRGLYTTWRRSSPYPSMATFDAPNREVCTIRRERTNTPLQALVTLNDPVYVEAAQALARLMVAASGDAPQRVVFGFWRVLSRAPRPGELERVLKLHATARERLAKDPDAAMRLATKPIGKAPDGVDVVDLAAWTVVGNVLLNLDETIMPR